VLEVELAEQAEECGAGKPAELESSSVVYLGTIERRDDARLWFAVEHLLDLSSIAALRSQWRENGAGSVG
jgi:hypothetical protein